jgi:protein-S-isoprenylcysteine O-methyltransferase Ste14
MGWGRLGGWLFTQRTWIPVPIALAILLTPPGRPSSALAPWLGGALVGVGEGIRVWAVRHIGAISRTRSDRLGPLVATGPFRRVRNPLYIGNATLWAGLAVSAGLPWLAPLIVLLLAIEYHAIVRWEEWLLESRLGDAYRDYCARVPRWMPLLVRMPEAKPRDPFSWRDTLFSERGTIIAIAVGFGLLFAKSLILKP